MSEKNNFLPLSIIILTNRCGKLFEQALCSAQFAAEIIIVDNQSQNDWDNLKQKYRFRIISHPQEIDNFAATRNKIAAQAQNNWIMFLDSDEKIPFKSQKIIAKNLQNQTVDAFYLRRVDYFYGQQMHHGEVGNVWKLRLAKKHELHFIRAIHEIGTSAGNISRSKAMIEHFPHQSVAAFFEKITYYAKAEAKLRFDNYSPVVNFLEFIFLPPGKFFWNFIIKLGFLDGIRGIIYALMMSLHSLFIRVNLYEMAKQKTIAAT